MIDGGEEYHTGQEFTDIGAAEFGKVNKAANLQGLMASVTSIKPGTDERLISFVLKSIFNA